MTDNKKEVKTNITTATEAGDSPQNTTISQTTTDNATKNMTEIQKKIYELDTTKGKEVGELYYQWQGAVNQANMSGTEEDRKAAEDARAKWEKASEELGQAKSGLESQLLGLTHPALYTPEERKKILTERKEMQEKAITEKPKDNSQFANPQLDEIRKQLQDNPLKGGDAASIDDGTGGEGNNNLTSSETREVKSES